MRYILLFFFFLSSLYLNAQQFPSETWHKGRAVLLEGDTLAGEIRYSQETDIIEIMLNGSETAIALTGRKLLYFEIFDNLSKRYREFYALPYALNGNYETTILFEVILEGRPVSILSRERIENEVVNSPYMMGGAFSRLVLKYNYYFLRPEGKISLVTKNRKALAYEFKSKVPQMKKYIKSNKIRPEKRPDLLRTVVYYNSLF